MIQTNRRSSLLHIIVALIVPHGVSHAMNLLQPSDTLLRPPYGYHDTTFHFDTMVETGVSTINYDSSGYVANSLRIWNNEQNALSMIDGFNPDTPIGQLRAEINANDDGVRGHLVAFGDVDLKASAMFDARFFFRDDWFLSIDLPVYSMALRKVCFVDQTKDETDADVRTRTLLTNNFAANVQSFGGLDIGPWERSGIGDVTTLINWFHNFPQNKEFLKNVRVNWRLGFSFPTGNGKMKSKVMHALWL